MLKYRPKSQLQSWSLAYHAIGAAIACGLVAAVYLLAIRPLSNRESDLGTRSAELSTGLALKEAVQNEHQQLTAQLLKVDGEIEQLLNRIPNVPRESDFLGQITTLAGQVGLDIIDYRPGSVSDEKGYKQMALTLSSDGSYEAICRFLHAIHELPRLNRVLKLDIAPNSSNLNYQMLMTLTIFFAPDSKLSIAQLD